MSAPVFESRLPVGSSANITVGFDTSARAIATPATALFGNDLPPPSLKDLVPRIAPRPVFFIYAGRKPSGGEELNEKFYAAAGQPKALWRIANAAHTGGITAQPREYERRVIGFFDRALLPASAP